MNDWATDAPVPPGHSRGAPIPWWAKVALKLAASRLPISHDRFARLGLFRHSFATDERRVVTGVQHDVERFRRCHGRLPRRILELGPGEITAKCITYAGLGIEETIFVDAGDYGPRDLSSYVQAADQAKRLGAAVPDLRGAVDRDDVFRRCRTTYLTEGLTSLRSIADSSADMVVSDQVLEHVRLADLGPVLAELARITAKGGLGRHGVEFHDHLGGRLQNLPFPPWLWEADWFARSGFYTNRVSASRLLDLVSDAGFGATILYRLIWSAPPIERRRIAAELQGGWSDEDLRICAFQVELARQ
jgi:hypothetical protein